jgi:hypothetical protein
MNQKQRDYAFGRISFLADGKISDVKKKLTTPAVELSFQEKIALIKKGKVVLKDNVSRYDNVDDAFDFSRYEKKKSIDMKKAEPIIEKIRTNATKAMDKVMLAIETEALAAILDFEKFIGSVS